VRGFEVIAGEREQRIVGDYIQRLAGDLEKALMTGDQQGLVNAWFDLRGAGMQLDIGNLHDPETGLLGRAARDSEARRR